MHFKLALLEAVAAIKELPSIFSSEPTSLSSDLPTDIFRASLYSPLGNILSSRSLFILDFKKVFLASAMY